MSSPFSFKVVEESVSFNAFVLLYNRLGNAKEQYILAVLRQNPGF